MLQNAEVWVQHGEQEQGIQVRGWTWGKQVHGLEAPETPWKLQRRGVGRGEAVLSPEVDRTTTKQRACHLDIPTSVSC